MQEGQFTPATRSGKVRIQAFSTLFVDETDIVLAVFMSRGHEVDECPPLTDDLRVGNVGRLAVAAGTWACRR